MQVQFLGGASGVGATCQLVTLGAMRFLVDAGVRVDRADRLPDLAALQGIQLDAIFITHAHADHIGALPLVVAHYPATPIYATTATIRLMEVMLGDAVRVMARRATEELELPLYDEALVATTLRLLRPLPLGTPTVPELPGVVVHVQRAGHIAGAVSLGFAAAAGRLTISGDVSATPQRTILGAAPFAPARPELLILESTYGSRLHPNRTLEERRLVEAVAAVIAQGGHCLIPAFALGRAQEIILILRAAQRDGVIPAFPIAVDGLVRSVCAAYAAFPEALTPALARHVRNGGRPFFGSNVQSIDTPMQREQVLTGPPSAIIASSGMLTGGPSVWYAERLAQRADAAIFFSGYLDEEAPGRRLLELTDTPPESRQMTFGERTVPVVCQLGRYSLSAHADGDELTALVRAVQPKAVALVHGDPEARAALAARLRGLTEVIIPQDGQVLTVAPGAHGGRRVVAPPPTPVVPLAPIGDGGAIDPAGLERLWTALRDGTGTQVLGIRELVRAWYGAVTDETPAQYMASALETPNPYFTPLPQAPGLWRLRAPTEVRRAQAVGGNGGPHQRPDTTGILASVDRQLSNAPDLYQRSVDPTSGAVTLRYFFPLIAAARDAEAIARITAATGVPITIWPQPHQGQLATVALALLPSGLTAERPPAIHHAQGRVEVRCLGQADPAAIAAAGTTFAAQTGLTLTIQVPGQELPAATAATDALTDYFEPAAQTARSELNFALNTARTWFPPATGCYKASADQARNTVTLRFHFPAVVRTNHAEKLAALADFLGWRIRIWPQPHQAMLIQTACEVLPPGVVVMGTPALQSASCEVVVRVQGPVAAAVLAEIEQAFVTRTGWRLVLR